LGGTGDAFNTLTLFYLVGAGFSLYQLRQHWGTFWDDTLSPQDRQLAGGAAFFLLVPIGVLLHEFGHMLAAWSTGSQVLGLHYFIYWGYVEYIPASDSALLAWYVALAGNFASYLLGIACLLAAIRVRKMKIIVRVVLAQLGVLELVQTLIAYPLMSPSPDLYGDWDTIYSFDAPVASWATLVVHVLSLAAFVFLVNRNRKARFLLRGN